VEGALALVATVISGAFLVPQLRRLRRTQDGGGVSLTAAGVGLVSTVAWATYGFGTESLALVAPSLIGAAQYAALVWLLRSTGHTSPLSVVAALLVIAVSGSASAIAGHGPWAGIGTALTIAVVVQYTPAVLDARRSETVSGISQSTWLLIGVNGSTWASYGLLVGDDAVAAYGVVLGVAAGAVLLAARRASVSEAVRTAVGS